MPYANSGSGGRGKPYWTHERTTQENVATPPVSAELRSQTGEAANAVSRLVVRKGRIARSRGR